MVIAGLILMSLLITPLLALGELFAVLGTMGFGIVLGVVVLSAWIIFYDVLRRRCAEKRNITSVRFILAAELPALIEGVIIFVWVWYLDSIGYYKGFLGGLFPVLYGMSLLMCAAYVMVGHVLLCVVRHMIEKNKKEE